MRTAGRGQDVRPEKTLYLHLEERLICRVPRQEFRPGRVPRHEIRPASSGS